MEAKDLRIGNWVNTFEGNRIIRYFVKDTANFDGLECNSCEVLQPIPLTEDWLIKFGFEKKEVFEGIKNNVWHKDGIKLGLSGTDFIDDSISVLYNSNFVRKLKYVHELQNLYHALTGEELTLNQ